MPASPFTFGKKEKDIKQAVYAGQYALAEKAETARLLALWKGLPRKWRSLIRRSLSRARDIVPLEQGVIQRLLDLLR